MTSVDLTQYSYGVSYNPSDTTTTAPRNAKSLIQTLQQSSSVAYIRLQWVDLINNIRFRVISKKYFIKLLESSRPGVGLTKASLGLVFLATAPGFGSSGEYLYVPDISSYRICPYAPGHASIMGFFQEKMPLPNGSLSVPLCPRTLLQRIVNDAKTKSKISFLVGVESEFILLRETSPKVVAVNHGDWSVSSKLPSGAVESVVLQEIAETLQEAGIELQMYHAEAAPGQYEVITGPLSPVEAADALIFTRETIYNVASKHKLRATFAPRLHSDSCGSAAHTHISVHSDRAIATRAEDADLAPSLNAPERSFLQGVLSHLPAICALTLPTTFSYARVLDGIWSGGTYVCWGTDNRETPVRLCGSSSIKSTNRPHFEIKSVDGTSSPYLAFAALLGAGAWGVKTGQKLTSGDVCETSVALMTSEERVKVGLEDTARLPPTIADARANLKGDNVMRDILGDTFVDAYANVNETLEKMFVGEDEDATVTKLVNFY
ncbi:unnamed protein product [Somion occarium]|uniref:Glutamine synthetase n=1 Tax=Somion occarium TaxID=3059160 RepID=A0ABP1DLB7_9APHY